MNEPVPALALASIRKAARAAQKRGVKLDPGMILALCEGRKA